MMLWFEVEEIKRAFKKDFGLLCLSGLYYSSLKLLVHLVQNLERFGSRFLQIQGFLSISKCSSSICTD